MHFCHAFVANCEIRHNFHFLRHKWNVVEGHISYSACWLGLGSSAIDGVVTTFIRAWFYIYLDDVRSGVGEGLMRVWFARLLILFRSWQLMCLSEEAVDWLSMRWSRPLLFVYSTARRGTFFLGTRRGAFNTLFWWWRIVSMCSLEDSSRRCSFSRY
jgi:hypothetical protein